VRGRGARRFLFVAGARSEWRLGRYARSGLVSLGSGEVSLGIMVYEDTMTFIVV